MKKFLTRDNKLSIYSTESIEDVKDEVLKLRFNDNAKNYLVTKNDVEIGIISLDYSMELQHDIKSVPYYRIDVVELYVLSDFRFVGNGWAMIKAIEKIVAIEERPGYVEKFKRVAFIEVKENDERSTQEIEFFLWKTHRYQKVNIYKTKGFNKSEIIESQNLYSFPRLTVEEK